MSLRIVSLTILALALAPGAALADSAAASPEPSAEPTAAPTAAPTKPTYIRFVEAELLLGDRVANSYAPNVTGRITNSIRAESEFKFLARSFAEFDYRRWSVDHPSGFVTQPLLNGSTFVPQQRFSEQDVTFNNGVVGVGHTYLATSTIIHSTSENLPTLHSSFGLGIEKLPDPTRPLSLFGSFYYYPEVSGKLAEDDGSRPKLRYKLETFRFGGALAIPQTRLFLTASLLADHYLRKENAPGDATHTSASLGVGFHV
jgi:hypothetical protein